MDKLNNCLTELRTAAPDLQYQLGEAMSRHTTFGIGGPADLFIKPKSEWELSAAVNILHKQDIPFLLIGNGSNMLVADAGIRGAVVCTMGMNNIRIGKDNQIVAQAGALLSAIARRAREAGLCGVEFAGGIPGSLGGAVFMNAGAYDGQMAGIAIQTIYMDGKGRMNAVDGEAHCFAYRHSVFRDHPEWTIIRSILQLAPGDPSAIAAKMEDFSQKRHAKQPLEYPSAGSTFKRPKGYFAGQLIESAGLKGVAVGGAQVSEKHAGFLINRGGATCDDMLRLIDLVRQRVRSLFGVDLECEVRIVGG